ncbi:MAG: 30S ribosome-binding factor RbfA [Deltaproteobacteria bacterium]|nr:30S ribosome-binding factor RbfA [Deltaproteobacteria bacterium]
MANIRLQRVADQIQEEISGLLTKGLKDPRIGFVTITGVEVSPDLKQAFVWFCTPGDEEERDRSLAGLQSSAGFIRKTLGKRLRLKNIPEFHFKYDDSLDRGNKIESILMDVRKQEGWDDPTRQRGSAEEVAAAMQAGQSFLVTSHLNPDGDAIAASLAARNILLQMGKDVVVYNPDPVPHNFEFLPGADAINTQPGEGPYDTSLVLDCSELERCGPLPPGYAHGKIVGVDHHLTTEPLGETHYLDPQASSIGEMIDRVCEYLPVELNLDLATCIYCSILTDTGSFRYSNTSPNALKVAARMVEQGVSPWDMTLKVYESNPLGRIQLLALVLETLELDSQGRWGSILVTQEMFEKTKTTKDMIDGFINYPRGIVGVEVAIQFRQAGQDNYKISFRSRGRINVAGIAQIFGGGGHRNAAGCSLEGALPDVRRRIYQAVEDSLAE